MTHVFYSDLIATSPDGHFTLEARSPHNGTIPCQNGKWPEPDDFRFRHRSDQSQFRYRLIDNRRRPWLRWRAGTGGGTVVWERWQHDFEDSPGELVVADDGWSILRTHRFQPEIIAVSPAGKDALRVQITGGGAKHRRRSGSVQWAASDDDCFSTAGAIWPAHSWRYFFTHAGRPHFTWRMADGRRLILDLKTPTLVPEPDPSDPLARTMLERERHDVLALLAMFAGRMDEVQRWFRRDRDADEPEDGDPRLRHVTAAFHLIGVLGMAEALPFLRAWEAIDCPAGSTGSSAMVADWWLETQYFRPILHHTLRLLGQEPLGFPTYHFTASRKERFSVPERIADRHARSAEVHAEMSAEQVLRLLGSPDHIRRHFGGEASPYFGIEDWEYDFRLGDGWITFRITWEDRYQVARITRIATVPAAWLESDQRPDQLLEW